VCVRECERGVVGVFPLKVSAVHTHATAMYAGLRVREA
jgi:hypothetical protein